MKGHKMKGTLRIILLLAAIWTLAACDKLDSSNVINETLPGKWAFSYHASDNLGFELSYEYVVFKEDGNCAIFYDGGQMEGTYRANDAFIRIDALNDEQTLMWKIASMSPSKIVAEYDYTPKEGGHILVTVTLEKM